MGVPPARPLGGASGFHQGGGLGTERDHARLGDAHQLGNGQAQHRAVVAAAGEDVAGGQRLDRAVEQDRRGAAVAERGHAAGGIAEQIEDDVGRGQLDALDADAVKVGQRALLDAALAVADDDEGRGRRVGLPRLLREEEQRLENALWLHAQGGGRGRHGRRVADIAQELGFDPVLVDIALQIVGCAHGRSCRFCGVGQAAARALGARPGPRRIDARNLPAE